MIRAVFTTLFALLAMSAQADVEIKEVTSPGGVNAWLVEEHAIPFVSLEIIIDGGTSLDEPGKRGATNLMMALIEEGAADMDARAFQTARESLAATYSFDAFDDSVTISAKFLTENSDAAIDLLRLALTQPRFDQDAVDRVRAQVIANIQSDANNPNRLAGAAFDAAAFGDHPYGSSPNGTEQSVAALTRDDIIEAHKNALVRSRVHVGAAGDITPDELGEMLDALLADLPADGPDLPDHVDFGLSGGITVVPFDTPQAVALFGQKGIKRDDDDFFAAYILNEIMGGNGVQSRLMEEVREKRGLTYGVYSFLVPKDHAEIYMGSVASANDRIAEAIDVIRQEWARMAETGVTQDELDAAKTYLTGAYPLRFDGNSEIAGILASMQATGLTPEYIVNRNALIDAVTLEEINRVASELLDPEGLHFVVVGRPEGLE